MIAQSLAKIKTLRRRQPKRLEMGDIFNQSLIGELSKVALGTNRNFQISTIYQSLKQRAIVQ